MIGPNSGIRICRPTEKQIARFWNKVHLGTKDDCWPWLGCQFQGYGRVNMFGKNHKASRIAYAIAFGETAERSVVAHRCDNPICVNPNHLFVTTQLGNMKDCINKGRRNTPKGENHWRNKKKAEAKLAL